ncbi:MAG: hypothetical protein M1483_06285 [Actinobacteria bacterium]|nr:hypothetical protein [Actinomycetota bacterium]MCL6105213.1 hypothetical protein [Actinomycetota bacterium]
MRMFKHFHLLLVPVMALLLGTTLAACSSSSTPLASSKPVTVNLGTTILTGHMISHPGWPKFSPANFTVPNNSTVVLTITNYDDGTAPLGNGSSYANVEGGTATVNGQPLTSLPVAQVSHTFTIPTLGLNVPIPAAATVASGSPRQPTKVVFTFKVTKGGTFTWYCMAPCGTGPTGMGGPMTTKGYMTGSFTVA